MVLRMDIPQPCVHGYLQPANQLSGRTLQRRAQRRCSASGQSSVVVSRVNNIQLSCRFQHVVKRRRS